MRYSLSAMACVLGVTGPAFAQEVEAGASIATPAIADPGPEASPQDDRLSFDVGAVLASEYISRGIGFAEEVSLQPYFTATLSLPGAVGGMVTDARIFVGSWSSIKLGAVESTEPGQLTRFYESDVYAGAALALDDRWTISATYFRYESPSDSFDGYNDFELIVGFDDAGLWSRALPLSNFALNPSVRVVQEAGRPGRADALYIQPSLTPAFDLSGMDNPARISVPLVIGLSDDYYDSVHGGQATFGFFRTGLSLSAAPLADTAPGLNVNAGFDLWLLNDQVANGLGDSELVGRFGISWAF